MTGGAGARLAALPTVTRYAVLLLLAEGVLGLLTFIGRVATAGGGTTVVGMILFLPLPIALLAIAWLLLDRSRFAWRAAILYQVVLALFAGLGLLSSYTALIGFLLAVGGLVLLLHSDTRGLFTRPDRM